MKNIRLTHVLTQPHFLQIIIIVDQNVIAMTKGLKNTLIQITANQTINKYHVVNFRLDDIIKL
jgi:hypothetical protein